MRLHSRTMRAIPSGSVTRFARHASLMARV
jgi:hypothetical protein